jgi:hypothetical protein
MYQRGDASEAFAQARHLHTPLGTPYRIAYLYDEVPHDYLPDFVGTLCDGGLLVAEAGRESEKSKGQALSKAEAARRLAQLKGGVYWIGTDQNLSVRRHYNLLYLHARRQSFSTYEEIAVALRASWPYGEEHNASEVIKRFGSRWSEVEVEAAFWKLAGDAAAQGHLLVDLTEVELSRSTFLILLDSDSPPILPDPLPESLEQTTDNFSLVSDEKEPLLESQGGISRPAFDASTLENAEIRDHFHRNLTAVMAVLTGEPRKQVALQYGLHPYSLARLEQRVQQFGQIACVPRATYHRERKLRPEFQDLLRKLYTQAVRPTVMAVYEDTQLQQLASTLSQKEETLILAPSYKQVWSFLHEIAQEKKVVEARSGLKHPPSERTSPQSFVLSIPYPAHICQVDEHTLDLLVVTPDGTVITRRVHGAVLICVKTAAIMGQSSLWIT